MKTVDISGFGGGYEDVCQQMLRNGIEWLKAHPDFKGVMKTFKNVTGLAIPENDDAKALEAAMMAGISDATGAMHHAVSSHLYYIAKHGYEGWIKMAEEKIPDRIYEWDGTPKSCPAGPMPSLND